MTRDTSELRALEHDLRGRFGCMRGILLALLAEGGLAEATRGDYLRSLEALLADADPVLERLLALATA